MRGGRDCKLSVTQLQPLPNFATKPRTDCYLRKATMRTILLATCRSSSQQAPLNVPMLLYINGGCCRYRCVPGSKTQMQSYTEPYAGKHTLSIMSGTPHRRHVVTWSMASDHQLVSARSLICAQDSSSVYVLSHRRGAEPGARS
jgi:hypothetical protein